MQMQHNEYKWDILRYVLRLCDKPTVLNMMNTCRYFNHEGAKDLLALHGPCRIFSAESFVSFFHFFRFKEGAERSHHFHSLELYLPSSPDMAAALRVFLVALGPQSRLKEIEISDLEKLCQADAQLIYALAALKSLTSIKLTEAAQYSLHFFDISQSSLVNVDMALDLKYPSRFSIDIIDLFRRFYHSLETLRANCSGKLRANVRSQNVVYPHMQSLDLDCQDEPRLSDYLVTFPDLTSLHLPGDSARYFRDDELEKARSYNITLQRVKGTWTDPMGYFGGGVQMMYAFALQVCVNTLSICDTDAGDNGMLESLPRFLRAVLDGACPSSLYYDARYPAIILDPAFFSAFTVKRDPPIETLSFEISVDNGIRTSILDKWLVSWKVSLVTRLPNLTLHTSHRSS